MKPVPLNVATSPANRLGRRVRIGTLAASVAALLGSMASAGELVHTEFELTGDNASIGTMWLSASRLTNTNVYNQPLGVGDYEYRFVTETFTPDTDGFYDFGQQYADVDTAMLVYVNGFDPEEPHSDFLGFNDDWHNPYSPELRAEELPDDMLCGTMDIRCPAVRLALEAGVRYQIVISTYNPEDSLDMALPQTFFITGPGGALIGTPQVIDTSRDWFGQHDEALNQDTVTFAGGTFRPDGAVVLDQPVLVQISGGTLDAHGGPIVLRGHVTGEGRLIIDGGGLVELAGVADNDGGVLVRHGELRVNGTSAGPLTVSDGARLSGSGTVHGPVQVGGTLAPGNSPGTLTIDGTLELSAGSRLALDIDGPGHGEGAGNHDRIVITGEDGRLVANGTVEPTLRGITGDADNDFTPALGDVFTVVEAEGGVEGSFAALVQPADGLADNTRFDALYGSHAVALVATPEHYAGYAATANQTSAAQALDAARPAAGPRPDGDTGALYQSLYLLGAPDLPGALQQLTGEVHAAALMVSRDSRRQMATGTAERLLELRDAHLETGAAQPADASVWIRPQWSSDRQRADRVASGYRRSADGIVFGLDRDLGTTVRAGVAVGALHNSVTAGTDNADVDVWQLELYGVRTFGQAYIDAGAGYGWTKYDVQRRSPLLNGTEAGSQGTARGRSLSTQLGVGYRLTGEGGSLEPRIGLRYDRDRRAGFEETGSAGALSVARQSLNSLQATADLRATWEISTGSALRLLPEVSAGYGRELSDRRAVSRHGWQQETFEVYAMEDRRDELRYSAALTVRPTDRLSLRAAYQGSAVRGYQNDTGSVTLSYAW